MHGLRVERRHLDKGTSLPLDLARHFSSRRGQAIVVTDKPDSMMEAVKKQWLKLEHQYRIDSARSLDQNHISKICDQLNYMQRVKFSATPPEDMLNSNITFATADDFISTASMCRTAYVTYEFSLVKLYMLTSWMPPRGLVVVYSQ